MRKKIYYLLMVLFAIMPGALLAQQSVLEEGFESTSAGAIPSGWTQNPSSAAKKWAVEVDNGSNLFDPAACATGIGRIKLVANGSGTSRSEVMLISPEMNINELSNPILIFDYAAIMHTGGIVDTLKVYFRPRSDRPWSLVKSYGAADNWVRDTVSFSSQTSTFQVAFGGVDNGGRGVVLDNIRFTGRPESEPVTGVEIYNKIHNEAKMRWSAGAEALTQSYNVIISTQSLSDPATATEADGLYIAERVESATYMTINASKNKALTPSTVYYYYIQTDCGFGDVSGWVSGSFKTACEPVESFNTSFDVPSDMDCWVAIGESYGSWKATAPTNANSANIHTGFGQNGEEVWMNYAVRSPFFGGPVHSGASTLWMNVIGRGSEGYTRVYTVSPRLADNVDLKDMQLSFWMYTSTKKAHLRVVVSDWPDDFSNAEDAGEITVRAESVFEPFTLTFEDIESSGKYVAFMLDGSDEYIGSNPQFPYVLIDDLVLEPKQECSPETKVIMFSSPLTTGTTANLKWNRSGAAKWNVKVSTTSINPGMDQGVIYNGQVEDPQLELENLLPATRYFYYVQPVCAGDVAGTWSNLQYFDTECPADGVATPFRENFDNIAMADYGQVSLPVCWSVKSATGSDVYVSRSGELANSLYNFVTTYATGLTYLITPKINADLKDCQVRFAYSITDRQMPIEVGIMTDPNDDATFTKISEFVMTETPSYNDYKWQEVMVSFDGYTGDGQYVAFKFGVSNVGYRFDDIIIEPKANCGEPTGLKLTGATSSSVTLDWTPSEYNETEWIIAYGKKGAVLGLNTVEKTGVAAHPYELTGLEENTVYDVYIRSSCDGENALGNWVGPMQVKTVSPATIPYECDFEDASKANAWTLKNGTQDNAWIVGDAVADENNNTGRALYISSDYGMTNVAVKQATYSYATRLFNLEAGMLDFEFDWRLPGAGTPGVDWNGRPTLQCNGAMLPFLVPEEIDVEGGVAYELYQFMGALQYGDGLRWDVGIPNGWILLSENKMLAHQTDEWQHFKRSYQLRKSGRYNLVIAYLTHNNYNSQYEPAAVDNVEVRANTTTCLTPENLRVFDITQTSAKVEFLCYNANEWKVIVTKEGLPTTEAINAVTGEEESVVYFGTQSTNPLQLTGLTEDSHYYVYFRPTCGSDQNWASAQFTTICNAVAVPLYYDFDSENSDGQTYAVDNYMLCWRRIPDVSRNSQYGLSDAAAQIVKFSPYMDIAQTNITNMLCLSSSSIAGVAPYAASPEMLSDVKALQISFRAVNEYDYAVRSTTLEVGVMTDPLDPATFERIETIVPRYSGQWKRYNVYFDGYEGTGRYIAMRVPVLSGSTAQLYIDDLKIDSISGCVPARELTVGNVTENSADISWSVIGEIGTYHVKVTTEPLGRWEDEANVYDDVVTGDNKLTLQGLRSSKMYYIYVRTRCEDDTYSEGMSEASFRTLCGAEEPLPYFEDFESYEVNSSPDCWTAVTSPLMGGATLQSLNYTSMLGEVVKSIGKLSLTISSDKFFPALIALPTMGAEDIRDLSLMFKGMSSMDYIIVGVISDLTNAETFVGIDTITLAVNNAWIDCTVDFADYTGNGKHIAFLLETNYFGKSFYLDNVMVRKTAVNCPDASAPQVLNVTSNTAMVRWADNMSVNSFELKVSTEEINPEIDDADVMNGESFTGLSAELTDLTPAEEYYVYMRNVCDGNSAGYWSAAVKFRTQCADPETIPYREDFSGYGEISDMGFFPSCWRNRVITYGSISPADQPEPYIENAVRPSMFMKAVYDGSDNSYAVVDIATPVVDFGTPNVAGYFMEVTVKSSAAGAPIYVGMMSDPSNASSFVAYDTIRVNTANEWENHVVNFLYHEGNEKHIAFRINSLDARTTYQVNITDINVDELLDCMPPFRVRADVRPSKAFISWMPGDKTNNEWKYYIGESQMSNIPFTDEEWNNSQWGDLNIVEVTSKTSLTVNGLQDWTDYYFYIKATGCDKFYSLPIMMTQSRGTCGRLTWADLPYTANFANNGFGADDPQYSAYFDCWVREDGFEGDPISYPYITADSTLYFKSVLDTVNYAYMPGVSTGADSIISKSQIRFTAKGLTAGAQVIVGVSGHYTEGWPSVSHFVFTPWDTIDLSTDFEEYVVKYEGYQWTQADDDYNYYTDIRVSLSVNEGGEYKISDFVWEEIPYCFTPEMTLKAYDKTGFTVNWKKLDDQDHWEVMYGEAGFDPAEGNIIPRTDTTYTVVNQREGTPYDIYVRANCGNGMSSDWARMSVTTKQTPAVYPYESGDLSDGTVIDADSICYAYRTVDMPAGPHKLGFDWKLANDAAAWLRVFVVPEDVMITADADFGLTKNTQPDNWTEIRTLTGETAWKSAEYDMYVSKANEGAVKILFVWFKSGSDVTEVVRNIKTSSSTACTVPEELSASSITSTSAVLSWISYNADAWDLDYYETANPGRRQTVLDVTPGYVLNNLNPDTEYAFEVVSQCKPTEYSESFAFHTACAPVDALYETFDNGVIDNCWTQYHGLFNEVVADPSKLKAVASVWEITNRALLGSTGTPHAKLTVSGRDCANWLVSPAIRLTQNSALSFDLALTAYDAQGPVANENGQVDDKFIVVISDDEGRTWKSANATLWNNEKGLDNSYNRIGNRSGRIEVDLSAFTGKTIRVGFYGESTVELESNDIHIDSVRIDCRINRPLDRTVCQGYPYYANGFEINREETEIPGVRQFLRVGHATTGCDTTYILNLTINQGYEYEYDVQICSNELPYTDRNFTGLTDTDTYTKTYPARNGCDSVVVLHLVVNEAYEVDRNLTIDESELPYTYHCHTFPVGTASSTYEVRCQTAEGCDSIVNLTLTVNRINAIGDVYDGSHLMLIPNPVKSGETVMVKYGFDADESRNVRIEVFNSAGLLTSQFDREGTLVEFNAPEISGVYIVRISTANGKSLTGRLIVE